MTQHDDGTPAVTVSDDTRKAPSEPLRLFYGRVVDEAELREALEIQGLDMEVAVLRIKVREHVDGDAEQQALMLKSMDALVRMVSARYRISTKRSNDLAGVFASVLDAVSGQFGGEL